MDWYGCGDGNILGTIGLDSLWLEAEYSPDCTAKSTADAFKTRVLNRHGHSDELRTDHAHAFIGQVMQLLSKQEKYRHTTTGGYSTTENATVERMWSYLGMCIQILNDNEYKNIESHLQAMVFTWNTMMSESLGVSPFEVMTGCMPRTGPSSVFDRKATQKEALSVPAIRVVAAEYTRFAAANADYNRKEMPIT